MYDVYLIHSQNDESQRRTQLTKQKGAVRLSPPLTDDVTIGDDNDIRVTPIGSTFEFQPEPLGTFRH